MRNSKKTARAMIRFVPQQVFSEGKVNVKITLRVNGQARDIATIPGDKIERLNKYAQHIANRLLSQIGQPSQRFGRFARSVQQLPQEGYIPALTNKLGQLERYVEYYPSRGLKRDFFTLKEVIKHYEEREPASSIA